MEIRRPMSEQKHELTIGAAVLDAAGEVCRTADLAGRASALAS
jgi:hypothetical protein